MSSSHPGDAYTRQWTGSALVQVMACRLLGTKPLPEPMLAYCQLCNLTISSAKMASILSRPHFYQTRSAWSMDQGSTKKRSAVHKFVPTVTKFCVMWEGLSLPHDTKCGNCRGKIVDRRVILIWSLIHGSSWSGLIKAGPGRDELKHLQLSQRALRQPWNSWIQHYTYHQKRSPSDWTL